MSFYGYTQLINVNDWKIDKTYNSLNSATTFAIKPCLGKIYRIDYYLDPGYNANYDTDRLGAIEDKVIFQHHIGAAWEENQGYNGTIWQVDSKIENDTTIYYLTKLANTNSVIPQISVDLYSPSYGEANNLPRFDEEHSNPAGFILQANPNWKITGELVGESNCLTGPTKDNTLTNFVTSSSDAIFKIIEEKSSDFDYKDKKDTDATDTKNIQLDLTNLNSTLGLLYNIIYGTGEKRQIEHTDYLDSKKSMPGLLAFLQQTNNEVTYQTIVLNLADGQLNSKTNNYDWNFSSQISSNNATSVELLIDETDDINTNQAVYCNFEITNWSENRITISGTSTPTANIKLVLKYTH